MTAHPSCSGAPDTPLGQHRTKAAGWGRSPVRRLQPFCLTLLRRVLVSVVLVWVATGSGFPDDTKENIMGATI